MKNNGREPTHWTAGKGYWQERKKIDAEYTQDGKFCYVRGTVYEVSVHNAGRVEYMRVHLEDTTGARESFPISLGYTWQNEKNRTNLLGKHVVLQHKENYQTWDIVEVTRG